jgi:hypothetical protein
MVTERAIINALIIGASFILAPFLIFSAFTFDYAPALFFGGFVAVVVAFFVLKERLCIWPLIGSGMAGGLNFLPLPLKATHIFCILLILYYISGYVLISQKRIKSGKGWFLWPILIITLIVLYHNHTLNVRALGGNTEGAKPAILIYLVVFAYFCGINVSAPSVNFLSKVPLYFVILTILSNIPNLLTTYDPHLAPYLIYITSDVNVDAYLKAGTFTGESNEAIGRFGFLGAVGASLQLYLLCHYPIGTWLHPSRWWVAGLSLICGILVLASGYRNILVGFATITLVGAWCYYSWRALIFPTIVLLVGFILIIGSMSNVIHLPLNKLPMIAQRTMSFLPGDWDEEAIESAKSSNDFRKGIQDVYIQEYLDKSPWIGNGFDINTKEFNNLNNLLDNGDPGLDHEYLQSKAFIEGKLFHTGWISVYDIVGIIGSVAFIVLGWNEICVAAHFVFGPKADRRSPLFPLYVWMLCSVVNMMFSFFTVFGAFGDTFVNLCVYAIVLSQLSDIENNSNVATALPDHKQQVEFRGLSGTHYNYQSRH